MSGAWFALATIAIGLVIRWYINAEAKRLDPTRAATRGERKKVRFGP